MCEIFDEIRQEGRAERFLEDLRSVIANLGVSVQEALAILSVPEVDRPHYLEMLRATEPEVKPA